MSMTGEGQLNADSQIGGSCRYTKYQTHRTACLLLGPEGQNHLQCKICNLIITGTVPKINFANCILTCMNHFKIYCRILHTKDRMFDRRYQ